jgi:hypothetical protein
LLNREAAVVDRGVVIDTSYSETVRHTASLSSSTKKTAVEGRYRLPPGAGITRE